MKSKAVIARVSGLTVYSAKYSTNQIVKIIESFSPDIVQFTCKLCKFEGVVKYLSEHKIAVWQSFSTKLVHYFKAARPILAVGPKDVASINHLIRHDCAIVADTKAELIQKLQQAIGNREMLHDIALKPTPAESNATIKLRCK